MGQLVLCAGLKFQVKTAVITLLLQEMSSLVLMTMDLVLKCFSGGLLQPMERLGQAGQIVKVAPGYARNRLIPEMLALPAIEKFVLLVQNQLKVLITFFLFTFFGHQGVLCKA